MFFENKATSINRSAKCGRQKIKCNLVINQKNVEMLLHSPFELDEVQIIDSVTEAEILNSYNVFQYAPFAHLKLPACTISAALLAPFLKNNKTTQQNCKNLMSSSISSIDDVSVPSAMFETGFFSSIQTIVLIFPHYFSTFLVLLIQFKLLSFISSSELNLMLSQPLSTRSDVLSTVATAVFSMSTLGEAQQIIDICRFIYAFPLYRALHWKEFPALRVNQLKSGKSVIVSGMQVWYKWLFSAVILCPKTTMVLMLLISGNRVLSLANSNQEIILSLLLLLIASHADVIVYESLTARCMKLALEQYLPPLDNYFGSSNVIWLTSLILTARPYLLFLIVLVTSLSK